MFGIGFNEVLVVFLVALLVYGPNQLPTLGREFAKGILRIRKYAEELKREIGLEELSHLHTNNYLDSILRIDPHAPNSDAHENTVQANNTQELKSELPDGGE